MLPVSSRSVERLGLVVKLQNSATAGFVARIGLLEANVFSLQYNVLPGILQNTHSLLSLFIFFSSSMEFRDVVAL